MQNCPVSGNLSDPADLGEAPPGPTRLQASAALLKTRDVLGFLRWCDEEFGEVFRLPVGGVGGITVFSRPEHIQQWLSKTDGKRYVKGPYFDALAEVGGRGVVTTDGDEWLRRRRSLTPAFTPRNITALTPLATRSLEKSMTVLDAVAVTGRPIDLSQHLHTLTLRVFLDTMLASSLSGSAAEVVALLEGQQRWLTGEVLTYWAPKWFPTPGERRGRPASMELRRRINQVVAERRAHPIDTPDLLSRLIAIRDEETGESLSNSELCNEMVQLLVGAYDTTALALSWTIALLASNPEAQARQRAEADAYTGDYQSLADLDQMSYAKAAFLEAQRIQGSPLVGFQATREDQIGGYRIPANGQVAWSGYLLGRSPRVWTDPDRFEPDRFLGDRAKTMHSYQHIPFGAGPHMCLGYRLAHLVGQFTLTMIAQRYEVSLQPGYELRHDFRPILGLKGGVPVTLRPRRARTSSTTTLREVTQ